MTLIKKDCRYFCQTTGPLITIPDGSTHPSFAVGIEALAAFEQWVSETLMPIVFQWIEEHRDVVYKRWRAGKQDDIGLVIAAAFEEVRKLPLYDQELAAFAANRRRLAAGKLKTKNLSWTKASKPVRLAMAKVSKARP
jgi:hypothetical protein